MHCVHENHAPLLVFHPFRGKRLAGEDNRLYHGQQETRNAIQLPLNWPLLKVAKYLHDRMAGHHAASDDMGTAVVDHATLSKVRPRDIVRRCQVRKHQMSACRAHYLLRP